GPGARGKKSGPTRNGQRLRLSERSERTSAWGWGPTRIGRCRFSASPVPRAGAGARGDGGRPSGARDDRSAWVRWRNGGRVCWTVADIRLLVGRPGKRTRPALPAGPARPAFL